MAGGRDRLGRWSRLRSPVPALWLVTGVVIGAAGGALAYVASQLNGVGESILAGTIAGLLVAAVVGWFASSTAISEVVVTIPQLSKVTFAVTRDHKVMARRIVVQMASRVAIQPLKDDTGRADEALSSLYTLFTFVRDLLDEDATTKGTPGRPKVDVLALNMLNRHLRPFLSEWHRRYEDWRGAHPDEPEAGWPDDERFRADLRRLRGELQPIAVAFARMADYDGYLEVIGLGPDQPDENDGEPPPAR